MDELLEQFLIEGREQIQQASDDLLALERQPGDAARIDSAFRAIHTLKGSAALFDIAPFGTVMHAAEDVIGALRSGERQADPTAVDALLACVAAAEAWLDAIALTGGLPLDAGARSRSLVAGLARPAPLQAVPPPALGRQAPQGPLTSVRYIPAPDCFFLGDDPLATIRSLPGLVSLEIALAEPPDLTRFDPFACRLVIHALTTASAEDVAVIFRLVPDQVEIEAAATTAPTPTDPGQRSLRIDAGRVDAMVDIVGELIVAKNRLGHLAATPALLASHAEIDRLIGRMHRAIMAVRMVPFSQTTRRLPRLVRDIAAQLGRQVEFTITGADIEADKAVVDALYEPLLHILRNAIDHGIEPPAARAAAGKPPVGQVGLVITQDGGRITVTVSDDGAGIDPARLRATARTRNLGPVDTMDDAALLDLLFAPGFSTASMVTAVSGRGVGMDAVRAAVQAMGGQTVITSRVGAGSALCLTLPQRAAMTTIVIVHAGAERYGIPIEIVAETVRIPWTDVQKVQGGEAFVLRDRTIPLLHLATLLRVTAERSATHAKVVVVTLDGHWTGLVVDGLAGRSDILLRPLSGLLAVTPGLLGAALMGDGQVLLVLDLPRLLA